jgi:bifunctional non-homologous end joining protein LigD
MSLEAYRHKRDFTRTAEPAGTSSSQPGPVLRRFVVGRHRARRLHYDLRLEIGGVLVSWAVPRGPTLVPLEKRLAVRTEDHPLEYLDFEGTITTGEYGAGDAIVWDHGSWDPQPGSDPDAWLTVGELKLALNGERLRGRFAMVRTGREGGREDWLLFHERDAWADEDWDIDRLPTSVLTGRTNEEVATGRPATVGPFRRIGDIDLSAARRSEPGFVKPMLATLVSEPSSDPDWLYELKLDGYRVEAVVQEGRTRLWTRQHNDAARYFPSFAAASGWLSASEAVVDGEMVALDRDGRPSFSLLQESIGAGGWGLRRASRSNAADAHAGKQDGQDAQTGQDASERDSDGPFAGKGSPRTGTRAEDVRLVYHAFDLLHLDGWDLTAVPLLHRKRVLRLVLREHPNVRFVSQVVADGEAFHRAVIEQGLEGTVAKRMSGPYEPGARSRSWLKIKVRREQEFVVIGYEPGQGQHGDLGSVLVATHEQDGWHFAGHVGSGMDARTRARLRAAVEAAPLERPVAADAPPSDSAHYGEPRTVIRVEFADRTTDGLVRQAAYKGTEPDREPRSVSRERPAAAPALGAQPTLHPSSGHPPGRREDPPSPASRLAGAPDQAADRPRDQATAEELAALDDLGHGGRWSVGGHEVQLTNLEKVMFPAAGFTKRDLIRYYTVIAPTLLPYLRDRPLNVHRWPDGVEGRTQFWQKQIPAHAPDWVARWDYPEAGRDQSHTYVVADRVATLAWLANQAVIDMHPWTSRLPDYQRPTYAYIDIDPGSQTTWADVVTLARLYRTALGHLGVRAAVKLTGKRGLQIWIHVSPRYSYDDTREWVGQLSHGVGAVVPDLVSWEWSKADRGGRARLDYTQNSPIRTLVAPYAVRPVPSGAVSAPIEWDELDDPDLHAQRWDLRTIVSRVARKGDLFAAVLTDAEDLPPLS